MKEASYKNPPVVAVVLVPVDGGLLAVRRAIEPCLGELSLPGGYVDPGETWQQAGAREVLEETGAVVDPDGIADLRVLSGSDGAVIVFGEARPLASMPSLPPNPEVSELAVLRAPAPLAFAPETRVVAEWFERRATGRRNPLPVAVVLVPVDGGLLTVRRAIEPRRGELALPGGYVNLGESWQQAGAREVLEETGATIDPDGIVDFRVRSAPDGTLLVFGESRPLAAAPSRARNPEVSELVVVRTPRTLAFPLHTEIAAEWFARRDRTR